MELLSSSSSDDDETEIAVNLVERRVIPKIPNYMDVIHALDNIEFKKHFRMNKVTVAGIIGEYEKSSIYENPITWARGISKSSAEKHIYMFLWFSSNKTTLRDVSQRFDVSISTAHLMNCGQNYHILGDGAYPIREWCLTPFGDYGNLSEGERIYNAKFCKTRVLIENTFGLLKSRFCQLLQIQMDDVDKMAKFILSCCVLHNLCIMTNDYLEEREIVAFQEIDDTEGNLRRLGEIKRNAIKDRFVVEHV
ncbi:hypothetical protein MML48_2g00013125 [Holotrichia oblita]|uniref:Uncharacterized protein n=1 Tax=Holotrichia oblita TaxID=644536 RepID=A0ACB9TMJ9_HOLOL|nr:hypothetical protein MML48_2g00013125 [Holotrichia oblita]